MTNKINNNNTQTQQDILSNVTWSERKPDRTTTWSENKRWVVAILGVLGLIGLVTIFYMLGVLFYAALGVVMLWGICMMTLMAKTAVDEILDDW